MDASSQNADPDLRDELRDDARTVTATAQNKLHEQVDANKGVAANQVKTVSSALNAAASQLGDSPDWLRSLIQQGAQTLERFSETIRTKDSRQLTQDVQRLARDNPGVFLAGCAAAGFAAARVLKAGVEDTASGSTNGSSSASVATPASQAQQPIERPPGAAPETVFSGMNRPGSQEMAAFEGEI